MKRTYYKSYLCQALSALAVMSAVSACVNDEYLFECGKNSAEGLSVMPAVSEGSLVTRATTESDVTLNEKHLQTLDVFVEHVTDGTGDGTFQNQYHLVSTTTTPIQEQVNNLLAEKWRAEGLQIGQYYNVYVATNNTQTKDTKDLSTFNVAALKALVADEVTDGIAVVDDATNNISWPWTEQFEDTPSGFIYKQYVSEANVEDVKVDGSLYGFTTEKEFMMDGVLENWTPTEGTLDQVFQPVTLNRAAAKIVLNVKFDADFLKSLTHNKVVDGDNVTWEEKPADQQVTISGTPAWRFYNFAFGAPVFTPETQGEGVEVHNSATLLRHPFEYAGEDKSFQIVTYTYPNKWAEADYATSAPSLVISVGYKTGSEATDYHYYRIPLVKNTVTEIERNHIYVVNATIATRGSEIQEDEDVTEDIQYAVLPWNDQTNSDVIENNVASVQHYYFRVNPTVYTLRGDGDQTVILNYSKASGTKVNWKLFTYDANGNQTGVVANNATNATRAWFYNANGAFTTTYSDNSGTDWSKMGVDIVQSSEGTAGSKGTVTVTSTALNNKAIKYIRLRVYLDEEATFQDGKETMYEDIIIRHFPTDNIQNISGRWSSYHDASNSTENVTMTTTSLSIAQSWVEEYGVEYTISTGTRTDYITYAQYAAHEGEDGYTIVNAQSTTNRTTFRTYVQNEDQRAAANGQSNAVLGEDGYCYWGVNPRASWQYRNDYDYRVITGYDWWGDPEYDYYRYTNLYRARYTHTYTYTEYSVTVPGASTGDWVDWDDRNSHSNSRTYTIRYSDQSQSNTSTFNAKVMQNGTMYAMVEAGSSGNYTTTTGNAQSLTNNHMYVIQISSTSASYVLGRPYVNETTHQSNDNVVSPAFMIASQLGAVTPFVSSNGPANAATHCSRYMEVAEDGTRYTGWRLPTQAEISVITGYQYGTIGGVEIPSAYQTIVPVLTGQWYHSLSGQEVEANPRAGEGSTTKSYLRCVRDLSAAEVDRLNGFDKIQEKYR